MSLLGRDTLLDAGPIVAALNPRDQWHKHVADAWPPLVGRLLTTEAALTEATHIMFRSRGNVWRPLALLLDAGIPILALHLPAHERCLGLMRRYEDAGMDYADASLVVLADALGIRRVFTLDRRGFSTYRGPGGRALQVIPEGEPGG